MRLSGRFVRKFNQMLTAIVIIVPQIRLPLLPKLQFVRCSRKLGKTTSVLKIRRILNPFPEEGEKYYPSPFLSWKLWGSRKWLYISQGKAANFPFLFLKENFVFIFQRMRNFISLKVGENRYFPLLDEKSFTRKLAFAFPNERNFIISLVGTKICSFFRDRREWSSKKREGRLFL